jgi:hypothetical protein
MIYSDEELLIFGIAAGLLYHEDIQEIVQSEFEYANIVAAANCIRPGELPSNLKELLNESSTTRKIIL